MTQRRTRGLRAAILTSLVLAIPTALLEGTAVNAASPAPAAVAAAAEDCAEAYPVAEVTVGQDVHGLTVTQGVTPTAFTGDVLGVLKDGVLPGIDLVMVRLDSPTIQQVGGIWQGMSGSPVYAGDGRLIGAVAYGFAFGPSPVAGITPFADMQSSEPSAPMPERVKVGARTAKVIARQTDVTEAQALQGFSELPSPLAVAGVPARFLDREPTRAWQPKQVTAAGSSPSAVTPTVDDVVAGGNLGVTYSTGDITQGAIGTVTSVCGGVVTGFGHPFNLLGATTYGMTGAETLYIQEDPVGTPFTVANFGPTVGTIDKDLITGVSGPKGDGPGGATVTSVVSHGPDLRTSESVVSVQEALASTTNYALVVNHLAVLKAFPPGSEVQNWTITGEDSAGPFVLRGGNRYADPIDVTGVAQWDLPDLVWALGFIPDVTIDSVTGISNVTDDPSPFRLARVEQWRGERWVKLDSDTPALARAGGKLRLRMVLTNPAGNTTVPVSYRIPFRAVGQRGRLILEPGFGFPFEGEPPSSIPDVKKLLRNFTRNDQFESTLFFFNGVNVGKKTPAVGRVVTGHRQVKVLVR